MLTPSEYREVYLDHAATTRPRVDVLRAMWPYLAERFGNPSSVHERGQGAARALDAARAWIANVTGARSDDVIFTSGGTEANNLAIIGLALANPRGRHMVSSPIEHESVLASLHFLEREAGFAISWVEVDAAGRVSPDAFAAALRPDTTLASIALINNEIGTVQPVAEFARFAHEVGALLHSDVVQAAEWLPLDALGADALSVSGHKLGAPQGIGAAVIDRRLALEPRVLGGGQENERRSGTQNLAGAVGLAAALRLAEREREMGAAERVSALRDELIGRILSSVPGATLTGPPPGPERAPHIASFVFPGVSGEILLLELERRGVLASSGSACAAGRSEPSHVLLACGIAGDLAQSAVRFSLGSDSTEADVAAAAAATVDALAVMLGPRVRG